MMGKGHLVFGANQVFAGIALAETTVGISPESAALFIPIYLVGCLTPDIDGKGSRISRSLGPITLVIAYLVSKLSGWLYHATKTKADTNRDGTHRAMTHTVLFAVMWSVVVLLLAHAIGAPWHQSGLAAAAWGLGCLGHCAGDMLTRSGVPLLFPWKLQERRWQSLWLVPKKWRFTTGSSTEDVVVLIMTGTGLVLFGSMVWLIMT